MNTKKFFPTKQGGFALLEVMISALVLAVGVIAFVKLSNVSMRRAQENNYLSQATASANALIEILRSDPSMANWFWANDTGNFFIDTVALAGYATQCQLGDTGDNGEVKLDDLSTLCTSTSTQLRQDWRNELLTSFAQNFQGIDGKAVMCLRANGGLAAAAVPPFDMRITVIWKYPRNGSYIAAAATDCPVAYAGPIPDPGNTLNTANPDRGYYEVFTTITDN